jgi:hypothetical protein
MGHQSDQMKKYFEYEMMDDSFIYDVSESGISSPPRMGYKRDTQSIICK